MCRRCTWLGRTIISTSCRLCTVPSRDSCSSSQGPTNAPQCLGHASQANFRNTTTMSIAAQRNQAHIMRWLHEQDPTLIDQLTNEGMSCMHFACQLGSLEAVEFIEEVRRGQLYVVHTGLYPFEAACAYGHFDIVQRLYETVPGIASYGDPLRRAAYGDPLRPRRDDQDRSRRRRIVAYLEEKLGAVRPTVPPKTVPPKNPGCCLLC